MNRSLQEKLANRFQTKLPPFTEECTFNEWLALVRDEVNFQPEWKVTADMWLDFFSFTRLLMYRDLNDKQWPETHVITSYSIHYTKLYEEQYFR